ncbi:MAG: hypothetical protein KatS3mg035_0534 [Bacteroidia bacterium]|nr:MAG: hypothetical protein KatS3mg035_0534 [Bacteroidia bacterium]
MNENTFSYEKSIERIKKIAEILREHPTQFEENLELFSEAMTLIKKCQDYIAQAELKVKAIIDGKLEDYDLENQKVITNKATDSLTSNPSSKDEENADLPF